jgi:hypothetical protein
MKRTRSIAGWSLALLALLVLLGLGYKLTHRGPKRGLILNTDQALAGYTLFSPLLSNNVYLINMEGEPVQTWKTDLAPGGAVYLLDNGHLLRGGRQEDNPRFRGGAIGGRIQEFDGEGNLVWDYFLGDGERTQHHDLEPLPNGNVLAIVWEYRSREDAIAAGRTPEAINDEGIWPCALLEIKPILPDGGEVVWEWHSWDHLVQDQYPDRENHGSIRDHPERIDINADHLGQSALTDEQREQHELLERQMQALGYAGGAEDVDDGGAGEGGNIGTLPDWLHTNSVAYHPEHDLIVLCTPRLSEIWVIDHSTTREEASGDTGGRFGRGGGILYRWGNPRIWDAGSEGERRLFGQHDARWIGGEKPGELRLLLFNNGIGRPSGKFSSVEELVLPFDPERGFLREEKEAFGPRGLAWSYVDEGRFYSPFISGAERLRNGNTLICQGTAGRIFEVTAEGKIVWEYRNEFGGDAKATSIAPDSPPTALFRASRIPEDAPVLRLVGR